MRIKVNWDKVLEPLHDLLRYLRIVNYRFLLLASIVLIVLTLWTVALPIGIIFYFKMDIYTAPLFFISWLAFWLRFFIYVDIETEEGKTIW